MRVLSAGSVFFLSVLSFVFITVVFSIIYSLVSRCVMRRCVGVRVCVHGLCDKRKGLIQIIGSVLE